MSCNASCITNPHAASPRGALPSRLHAARFHRYVLLLERKCLRFESGKGAGQWIAPTAAFFPTAEMDHELRSTLMLLELPIVEPPPGVEMLLRSACVHTSSRSGANPNSIAKATPAVVRNHLVTLHSGWEGELNDAQCQELLQYCLSDLCSEALDPASASSAEEKEQARRIRDEVSQLPLISLRNGNRTSFASSAICVVLCSAEDLMLRLTPALVMSVHPTSLLWAHLHELVDVDAFSGKLSLLPKLPLELLPRLVLPAHWEHQTHQRLADDDDVEDGRSAAELARVWAFISRHHAASVVPDVFNSWPMIPSTDGTAHAFGHTTMLQVPDGSSDLLQRCLERLGCVYLHPAVQEWYTHRLQAHQSEALSMHPDLVACTPLLSVESALQALQEALRSTPLDAAADRDSAASGRTSALLAEQRLVEATPAERHSLRDFLTSGVHVFRNALSDARPAEDGEEIFQCDHCDFVSTYEVVIAHEQTCTAGQEDVGASYDVLTKSRLVRSLPIFQVAGFAEDFTSIDLEVHMLPPVDVGVDSFNAKLLDQLCKLGHERVIFLRNFTNPAVGLCVTDVKLNQLLHNLNVPKLELSSFYMQHVLPRIDDLPQELSDHVMHQVLRSLTQLKEGEMGAEIEAALMEMAFVPSEDGSLHRPSELFHKCILMTPLGEALSKATCHARFIQLRWLLTCEDPSELQALETLGLRTSVTRRFVVDLAIESSQMDGDCDLSAALLQHICNDTLLVCGETDTTMALEAFRSEMCSIEWLPVRVDDRGVLPLPEERHSSPRARACDVRPESDAPLVSASTRLLCHLSPLPAEVKSFFGWNQPPPLSVLLAQLQAMALVSVDDLNRAQHTEFSGHMRKLYETLDRVLCSLKPEQPSDQDSAHLQRVGVTACVWLEDRFCFVAPLRVAKSGCGGANLMPHLFKLPPWLQQHCETVMDMLGVRQAFDAADVKWAVSEARTVPFEEKPAEKTIRALLQGDRQGTDEAFMSDSILNEIKGILGQYPDGDAVLDELLQHADDSGATVVRLVLEEEGVQHGTLSLWPQLQEHVYEGDESSQGPGLYCYNNGVGLPDDEDCFAIRYIRSDSQAGRATSGLFRPGINSMYHLTDTPALLSNHRWLFFDPHRRAFADGGTEVKLAVGADYDGDAASSPTDFADQFSPLCLFGGGDDGDTHWDMRSRYRGTLLRLPLRRASDRSKLGGPYSHDKAHQLLDRLRARGPEILLFLKNVRRIEVYARGPGGRPTRSNISNFHTKLRFRVERQEEWASGARAVAQCMQSMPQHEQLYQHLVTAEAIIESCMLTMRVTSPIAPEQPISESRWLVCNALTMTEEMRTLCLSNEGLGLKLIPWVGVAAKLEQEPIEGRAFSSLPLPIKTGLPVHVNGSFEVIDGREKLWTMRDGLQGEASVKALWNQLLISDVVSLCYSAVLVKVAEMVPPGHFFTLWPTEVAESFQSMVKAVYRRIVHLKVLPGRERWLSPARDARGEPKVMLRAEQDLPNDGIRRALRQTANDELSRAGVAVLEVVLPSPVLKLLQDALQALDLSTLKQIDPQVARRFFRRTEAQWPGKMAWLEHLSRISGVKLLLFCLYEQITLDTPLLITGNPHMHELSGLPFLPILAAPQAPWQLHWATIQLQRDLRGNQAPRLALLSPEFLTDIGLTREASEPTGWVDAFLYQVHRVVDTHAMNGVGEGKLLEFVTKLASARAHETTSGMPGHSDPVRVKGALCSNLMAVKRMDADSREDKNLQLDVWVGTLLHECVPELRAWVSAPENGAALRRWVLHCYPQLLAILSSVNTSGGFSRLVVNNLKAAILDLPVFTIPEAVQAESGWHRQVSLLPKLLGARRVDEPHPAWWLSVGACLKGLAGPAGARWLQCADVDEERLLGLLGVPQLKTVDFYIEEIFPRLSSLMQTVPEAGEFVAHMLSNLDSLVSEGGERAFDALKNLPCINSPLGLLRLSELTHPDTVSNVAPEVNNEGFDAVFFAPDATLRSTVPTAQLERLGMDSRRGILAAARRVESGQASEAVWACLVLNHATLFGEQPVRVPAQRLHVAPMSSEDFVVELLGDLKLPVMAQGEPGVPWPAGVHGTPFAPCAAVQPYAKRFLVSASSQVLKSDAPLAPPRLADMLGWNERVPLEVLLMQLRAISPPAAADAGHDAGQEEFQPSIEQVVALYAALADSDDWDQIEPQWKEDLASLRCVPVSAQDERGQHTSLGGVVMRLPSEVALSKQSEAEPAEAGPTRYLCMACCSTQLSADSCNNPRCGTYNSRTLAEFVPTSQPALQSYSLNPRLHCLHPACHAFFPRLLESLGVRRHFTPDDYGLTVEHTKLQSAARRYLSRRANGATRLQAAARGFLACRLKRRLNQSLSGEAITAVHTAVGRTGSNSATLLLCSVMERLPEIRRRRRGPNEAALSAFGEVVRLLREAATQCTLSPVAPNTALSPVALASHRRGLLGEPSVALDDGRRVDPVALNESRDDYQAKQAVIASAEDAELAPAQSARDCSRDRLIKALEVAEDRKLSLVGTGSDRELEEMVRATEQRRHAMESAARSATEVAASIDPRLGSRPPLSHDDAAKLASADGESTALSTALIGSAVAMLDNYMSPPTVQQTEAAALRCSHAMSAVDLFAASTAPPAAAIVGELCALHAAIAAESAFWKSYSPVEAFPLHALLAASRAEVERLRQLEVHYTSVLGEASKLAAERSMHLEAARLSRTGGVQTLMAELQQFHAELVEGQDSLEDATTKLRRATRPLNASGDPVATAAALQAARDAVNSIEARLHHAHAQAHEQLHLFPELERRLARTVPLELAPIYREHRSLHQYQSIDGGIFDKATCVLHTEFQSNHVVYQALLDDRRVALKEYRTDARSLARCYKEALVLRRLHHPGIVEIEAIFAFESNLYLQMPFYARGTLRQWAQQQQPDHTALATVLQLVLEALAHLHAHRVFHLDLKPENILIDAAGRPHIADYDISHDGATRAVARRQTHMGVTRVGTDGFVAPELEAGAEASAAADLYSLGRTIEAVVPDEPLRRSPPLSALIEQLTRQDPAARPSAAHAAQHVYFAPLLAGRFEGTRECVICLEPRQLSDGVCCSPGRPDEPVHLTCRDCLNTHVRRAALELPPSGNRDDDEAERARMQRQHVMRQGHVCCPLHPRECRAPAFSEASLARALPSHTFVAYMVSRQQLTEQRLARESEARMQELLQAELARLSALSERERLVRSHYMAIAQLLTPRCPRCSTAFIDFQGCCALQCRSCSAHFCAWCLHPSTRNDENHAHVAACNEKPEGADMFFPGDQYAAFLARRQKNVTRDELAKIPPDLAGDVYDMLHPLIAGLNLERPGLTLERPDREDAMDLG